MQAATSDPPILTGNAAAQALWHPDLVPPPRPPDHAPRRRALLDTLESLDLGRVETVAATIMSERLGEPNEPELDIVAASRDVPSYTLATVFGLAAREQIRADVERIARVIGRNEPSSSESDMATERLLDLFTDHPDHPDPVVPVSLLSQNYDATSALARTAILIAHTSAATLNSSRTVRFAVATIDGNDIKAGSTVEVDLADMPFGAEPHRCPGEGLANAVVSGMLHALEGNDYRFDSDLVNVDSDGVPTRFIMARSPEEAVK